MGSCKRDRLNDLIDAFSITDGCATFLAYVLVIALLVVSVSLLWASCTTPSPPPLKWDPALATQIPGNQPWTPAAPAPPAD